MPYEKRNREASEMFLTPSYDLSISSNSHYEVKSHKFIIVSLTQRLLTTLRRLQCKQQVCYAIIHTNAV